jgi:hypothetical protein
MRMRGSEGRQKPGKILRSWELTVRELGEAGIIDTFSWELARNISQTNRDSISRILLASCGPALIEIGALFLLDSISDMISRNGAKLYHKTVRKAYSRILVSLGDGQELDQELSLLFPSDIRDGNSTFSEHGVSS